MANILKAVAVASLVICGAAQANTVSVIDLFTAAQAPLVDSTIDGNVRTSQIPAAIPDATILGGFRELIVDLKTSTDPAVNNANINVSGVTGQLSFNVDSGATATGTVRWDGSVAGADNAPTSAINYTGLGGVNIGNVFTDSFEVQTVFSDAGFQFVIEAYNTSTQWSKVSILSNAHPVPASTLIPLIAFLDCTNAFPVPGVTVTCGAGGAVDFSTLGALQVVIDPNGVFTSLDLSLNQVTVVPEPASVALVGLALLGAGVASRRRKTQA